MKLKISMVLGIFLMSFLLQSCCEDAPPFFNIIDFEISLQKNRASTPTEFLMEDDSLNLSLDQLQINIDYDVEYISETSPFNFLNGVSFMTPVYGTSCEYPGVQGSKEEMLREFSIITKNDINETYKAGAIINNLFSYNSNISLDSFVESNLSNNIQGETMSLLYTDRGDTNTEDPFIFDIIIELSTGERYEKQTPAITVKY